VAESFPALLDALEKHAVSKLDGIELGEIEWYQRLRNQFYHQGNGLTAERDKVEIYAQLANALFRNLFGYDLVQRVSPRTDNLGQFMSAWTSIEKGLRYLAQENSPSDRRPTALFDIIRLIRMARLLSPKEIAELEVLREVRNAVVHGQSDLETTLTPEIMSQARIYADRFSSGEMESKNPG
jgi:hypothetical protein